MQPESQSRQQGSILIIVLILLTIAISLSLYITTVSRDVVRSSQMIMDKLQAKLEAESLTEKLKYVVATGRFGSWYVDNLSGNRELPVRLNLRGIPIKAGNSEIKLLDCGSKLGVSPPPASLIGHILAGSGVKADIVATAADSLVDWVDEDDLKHLNGAERYYYDFEKGYQYLPRNDIFVQGVEELKLIKGFDDEVYRKISNEIIETKTRPININTADAVVLEAIMGISREHAEQVVQMREKTGSLAMADVVGITGKGLTFMDEYTTNFTSLAVVVEINTRVGEAGEHVTSIIDFKSTRLNPYVVEKYNN